MAAKFDPEEAEQFLQLTMAGVFMNQDVGSVASAIGALRACAAWLERNSKNSEQIALADKWSKERARDPGEPRKRTWEN